MNTIYPRPLSVTTTSDARVSVTAVNLNEAAAAFAAILSDAGMTVVANGTPITVTYGDLSADFAYGAEEAYILTAAPTGIAVTAQTSRGAYYAMTTLVQLVENGTVPAVTVKDAPRNHLRGVIEGFYGVAWTQEFRKELFEFMGKNKLNVYIYAPKDDPKHRAEWRASYTGTELTRMQDLIHAADENYVKFVYAISPGNDINLEDGYEADFAALMAKCESMYDLGVRDFAIFLDDIPTLAAEGHAKLLNDFQEQFVLTHEGASDLIGITPEYCDPMLTPYTDRFSPLIRSDVELMWTGKDVVPDTITNASLESITKAYGRGLFIWWNYPVNDAGGIFNHLFMGPCMGLENTLYRTTTGLVSNPMNEGYASLFSLFTTADYLWNPDVYDMDASFAAAVRYLTPTMTEEMTLFIHMTEASVMNGHTDSVEMAALLAAYESEPTTANADALIAAFERMIVAANVLKTNKKLYTEAPGYVNKFHAYGEMGKAYFTLQKALAEGKDDTAARATYRAAAEGIAGIPSIVSMNVLTPFFAQISL